MSGYAFDDERHAVMVCWSAGVADIAKTVTIVDRAISGEQVQRLTRSLAL